LQKSQKSQKIAESYDHNIDPTTTEGNHSDLKLFSGCSSSEIFYNSIYL
jgi:hypothetical protein